MFLLNSRLDLFSAAYFHRHPFSRSYGVNLPSSLTTLLPLVLGFSPHPPVSVYGTGTSPIHTAFLVSVQSSASLLVFRSLSPHSTNGAVRLCSCVPVLNSFGGYGISTVCASTTPFGLALAPGLPWADDPTPRNLRFSAITILTQFSLLIPAFSLLSRPHVLSIMLHPIIECSPTN